MKKLLLAALLLGLGCARAATPLILVSFDAFRWDYMQKHPDETPHLRALAQEGVRLQQLIPLYPSNTFPNHYSIVTGLYPAHSGIVNNIMFDSATGEFFHYNQFHSTGNAAWWLGEPIWVTAIRQGGHAGVWLWPGSEAAVAGVRPEVWHPYDPHLSFEARRDEMVAWLKKVGHDRPTLAVCYVEETNSIGHKFGPDAPELAAALKQADERIESLETALQAAGIEHNLVVVSDHGMTPISLSRIVVINQYLDPATVQMDFDGPAAGLRPVGSNTVENIMQAFAHLEHAKAYRVEDLPARFHMTAGPRVPPVWIVPDEGWEVYTQKAFDAYKLKFNKGDHGYDPALPSMRGILFAHGPAFKSGVELAPEENVHIYNLLCAALGLKPAPNDGDDRLVRAMLK
jgi:predicted AlkP superfamily pyrophosphatase or phosphodiesterase